LYGPNFTVGRFTTGSKDLVREAAESNLNGRCFVDGRENSYNVDRPIARLCLTVQVGNEVNSSLENISGNQTFNPEIQNL